MSRPRALARLVLLPAGFLLPAPPAAATGAAAGVGAVVGDAAVVSGVAFAGSCAAVLQPDRVKTVTRWAGTASAAGAVARTSVTCSVTQGGVSHGATGAADGPVATVQGSFAKGDAIFLVQRVCVSMAAEVPGLGTVTTPPRCAELRD